VVLEQSEDLGALLAARVVDCSSGGGRKVGRGEESGPVLAREEPKEEEMGAEWSQVELQAECGQTAGRV